jgi:hypothetical protein
MVGLAGWMDVWTGLDCINWITKNKKEDKKEKERNKEKRADHA